MKRPDYRAPKESDRVGQELTTLTKKFPEDRVLQRIRDTEYGIERKQKKEQKGGMGFGQQEEEKKPKGKTLFNNKLNNQILKERKDKEVKEKEFLKELTLKSLKKRSKTVEKRREYKLKDKEDRQKGRELCDEKRKKPLESVVKNIFMKMEEVENCRFEPKITKNRKYMNQDDQEGKDYYEKMGENFCISNPELYKKGKLKKAKALYQKMKYEDCMTQLLEGFDLVKVYQHYKPKEHKVWKNGKEALEEFENQTRANKNKKSASPTKPVMDKEQIKMQKDHDLTPE